MITLSQLQSFLDNYLIFDKKLDISKIDPYMSNGLMVRGKEEIKKIGFGVSASIALFEKASAEKCDVIVVHHSFNLPSYNRYDPIFQKRIGYLLENKISLFGYHFLLDAHPEIGHNVQILTTLHAKPIKPFLHHGYPWGWIGKVEKVKYFDEILNDFKSYLSKRITVYNFGPQKIKTIVAVSGKGAPAPSEMIDLINHKVDLYITGEVHEWNRELFREAKINFIAGGHYATEVFGLRALMKKIEEKFSPIHTAWLKLTNEI